MSSAYAAQALRLLTKLFEGARDASRAAAMAAYMRNQFPFLGIPAPERAALTREAWRQLGAPTEADLAALARALWVLPEREYQYAALDLLGRSIQCCGPALVDVTRELATTKSWWDTVDAVAKVIGALVLRFPEVANTMDAWAKNEDMWLRRTAILHQLGFKSRTDTARLFGYCAAMAGEREFFIRKAIGWALREYSKTDAEAVERFVAQHDSELSGLPKREALLWLGGGRRKAGASGRGRGTGPRGSPPRSAGFA